MQNYNEKIVGSNEGTSNAGLNSFFQRTYSFMMLAVAVSGVVAWMMSTVFEQQYVNMMTSMGSLTWIILMIAQFGIVFLIGRNSIKNPGAAFGGLMAFAIVEGFVLGSIFLIFDLGTIASAFAVAAVDFAAMALFGFFSKKNMAGMAPILFGATIALIISSVVNIFLHSSGMQWLISIAAIVIFSIWTMFDNNQLKNTYYQMESAGITDYNGIAVNGALNLYMDFINIFINLVYIFGGSSRN
ncbi:MAG: Bax inhibitor-1/YccA family protein [Lactobacillaceae bacterium]|jgi:FtsH-binding integral membrane protein|nr:Bax inhibitor-1/YccA family protein [Lactobacillaceae bacterium]